MTLNDLISIALLNGGTVKKKGCELLVTFDDPEDENVFFEKLPLTISFSTNGSRFNEHGDYLGGAVYGFMTCENCGPVRERCAGCKARGEG